MSARKKNRGCVYLRRSSGKQESSVEMQLDWAIAEARKAGVRLEAGPEDLADMKRRGLTHHKDIFLDDAITGADLNRPGLIAMQHHVMAQREVSHLFIHLPDRLARPAQPTEGMQVEQGFQRAGVTIVFSNRVAPPQRKGESDFGQQVAAMYSYAESGEFLNKLATRIIQVQVALARQGHWTGGRPPYGFVRVRVDADGRQTEMADRESIRRPGSHTEIRPKDLNKIKVWLMILAWCGEYGWGTKRIAIELNKLGIPSPDAGRRRKDGRKNGSVSGLWTANTVRSLIKNSAIIGIARYGVQSEGHHRRLGDQGQVRFLEDEDQRPDGVPRVLTNPPERVITAPMPGFQPPAAPEDFERCQAVLRERGRCQRGIPRSSDLGKYPLSTRVYDMNCGTRMSGRSSGRRRLYTCSEYINHQRCHHNRVDAEALLEFVLGVLRQQVFLAGGEAALRARLKQLSKDDHADEQQASQRERVEGQLSIAREELKRIEPNLARAKDQAEYDVIRHLFHQKRTHVQTLENELTALQAQSGAGMAGADLQVEMAMALYRDLERITNEPAARPAIRQLLGQLGVQIGLNFVQALKKTRSVCRLTGGVITLGHATPPSAPHPGHDEDRDDWKNTGNNPRGDASSPPNPPTDNGETPSAGPSGHSEGVSYSKDNRGDKI